MIAFEIAAGRLSAIWPFSGVHENRTVCVDDSGEASIQEDEGVPESLRIVAGSVTPFGCILSFAHPKPQSWWKAHIRYHYFVSKKEASYDALCRWLRWSSVRLSES